MQQVQVVKGEPAGLNFGHEVRVARIGLLLYFGDFCDDVEECGLVLAFEQEYLEVGDGAHVDCLDEVVGVVDGECNDVAEVVFEKAVERFVVLGEFEQGLYQFCSSDDVIEGLFVGLLLDGLEELVDGVEGVLVEFSGLVALGQHDEEFADHLVVFLGIGVDQFLGPDQVL